MSMFPPGPPRPNRGMPGHGMPKPGQGVDPMQAMMAGLNMPPPDPSGMGMMGGGDPALMGPDGLPPGGTMPSPDAKTGGSDLLMALTGGMPPGAIPGMDMPTDPTLDTSGLGQPDEPSIEALLEALAMAQMGGMGGGAGSSGVPMPPASMGTVPPMGPGPGY